MLWTKADAVAAIESRSRAFYTYVNGNHAQVGVVNGTYGKYLRTYADGRWNDNLLSLDRC